MRLHRCFAPLAPLALLAVLTLVAGCASTAGPFVTSVVSAGPGLLRVEKCEVAFSPWGHAHIENGECCVEMVPVQPGDPAVPRAVAATPAR